MSYDVALYLNHIEFPLSEWLAVLEPFGAQLKGTQQTASSAYATNLISEWTVNTEDCVLCLELQDVGTANFVKPQEVHWKILISRQGRHPRGAWTQFAIPFRAITLLENVAFYDLQHDVYIEDANSFTVFAEAQLKAFGISKMFDLGLIEGNGKINFDHT